MTERLPWLREAAVAALLASSGALALESLRPGVVGSTLPLAAPVALAVLAAAAVAALPPRATPPLRAWQLLAFGWIAAAAGLSVAAILRHGTPFYLPLGVLASAAAWSACTALWLRRPER